MYKVLLEQQAERDLRRLTIKDYRRVITPLKALADNPRPPGCHKISGSKRDWRIRVGTYRVIYEIDDKAATVKVMRIRHRREAYR